MNRQKFSYDSTKDPLFQAYKNQYVRQGQQAAQNVIGQSAALTGGYGNTWAATAGSQAYQDYLTRLNELLPEMEARAYERYTGEGEQLQNQLSVASALENQEYERFRNALADWQAQQKSGGGGKKKDDKKEDKKTGIFSTIANNVKDFVDKYNRQQQETAAQNETAQNNAGIWAGYRPDASESQQEEMAALYNQLNSNNQSRTDNPIERAKNINLGRKKQTQQQQTKDFLKEY
ncbi:MAG: hypothetical protein IKH30_01660 [Clostridia bacterium]|nr:hypothetical protein [Clostridia bacterium]